MGQQNKDLVDTKVITPYTHPIGMTHEVTRQDPGFGSSDLGSVVDYIEQSWKGGADLSKAIGHGLNLASRYAGLVGVPEKGEDGVEFYDTAIKSCTKICDKIHNVEVSMGNCGNYKIAGDLLRMKKKARLSLYNLVVRKICHLHNMKSESLGKCSQDALSSMSTVDAGVLGHALVGLGRYGDAERFLKLASADDAGYGLAKMYDDMGMHYKASSFFDMIATGGDGDNALDKGIALVHAGSYKDALDCLDGVRDSEAIATYYKAYSRYRMGEYEKAADLYDAAAGFGVFADARQMHEMMKDMHTSTRDRIRLPLLAADVSGGFRGMPELQYAVYMAQQEAGGRQYDFESLEFGPYSADLEKDILSNTRLFSIDAGGVFDGPRVCSITSHGKERLSELARSADSDSAGSLLGKYSLIPQAELVDLVYGTFTTCPDTKSLMDRLEESKNMAESGIAEGMHPAFEYVNLHAGHARSILSGIDGSRDTAWKRATINISGMIAHVCDRVIQYAGPPVDHARLRTALADLEECGDLLFKYCDMHGIVEYPRIKAGNIS